jgi:subtilisin family serine protease
MRKAWMGALVAAVVVLGVLTPVVPSGADGPESSWIVTLVDGADPRGEGRRLAQQHGGRTGHVYEHAINGFQFLGTERAARNLERNPRVHAVVADGVVHALQQTEPTGVRRIDAPAAHAAAHDGTGVTVAVIDTGIDLEHPDLVENIDPTLAKDCTGTMPTADDDQGHGTHVAGTIAADDNGFGVVGVAPGATLVPVKVLGSNGSGSWSAVICGIDHVTANADVIDVANLSLGGAGSSKGCTDGDALEKAVCSAVGAGVTVVVAAGNDAKDAAGFVPAAYPVALTVSAYSDSDGTSATVCSSSRGPFKSCDEVFASFSNFGTIVDVMAPGVSINSTLRGGGYGTKSGTSMAAPHVAGVAALVIASNAASTPDQIRALLKATGECPGGTLASASGTCAGTWSGDPDTVAEPMVNAARAAGGSTDTPDEPIDDEPVTDPPAGITLSATGYKVKGVQHADLTWSGATSTNVDIVRNGMTVTTTANDGAHTDSTGTKGGGTYTYKVCEAETSICSAEVTVTF